MSDDAGVSDYMSHGDMPPTRRRTIQEGGRRGTRPSRPSRPMRQPSSAATRKRQEEAKKRAETQRKRAEADKKKRAEAERKRKAEADKKKKAEAAAKKKAEADAARLQRQQSSTSMMGPGMMGPRQPQYPPSTYDSGDGIPQETNAYGEPIPTGEDAVALKESMNSFSKIRIFEDAGAADEAPAEEPAE